MHHASKKGLWETQYVHDLRAKRNKAERRYLVSKSAKHKELEMKHPKI